MEAEHQLETAEQWYNRTTTLDRNWRESKREKDRLRRRKEQGGTIPKPQKQRQILPQLLVWQRRQEMLSQ